MAEEQQIQIPRVKLGSQGFEVSKLGYGCMALTGVYNSPVSDEDGILIIKEAFKRGITFFDTSDSYGPHLNEILVGKALKQLPREKVEIATKFGITRVGGSISMAVHGSPEYVRSCCEASLKRLDIEYIDLYYQHRVDTSVPIEETVSNHAHLIIPSVYSFFLSHFVLVAKKIDWLVSFKIDVVDLYMSELKKLVQEGKIKYIGLSEAGPETIRRAHAVHPITAVQMEWSLWTRDIEEEIVPLCRELGIGIVPYSPLGGGFFAGKAIVETLPAGSFLATHPRFITENLDKNRHIYTRIESLAAKYQCSPAQLSLAWVLQQGDDVVPIPGTTKLKNLDQNIGSLRVKLTENDLTEISEAVPESEVSGNRTYDSMMHSTWKYAKTPPKVNDLST